MKLPHVKDAHVNDAVALFYQFNPICGQHIIYFLFSAGALGYFPSYTLGAMMAAQLFETAHKEIPSLDEKIQKVEFCSYFFSDFNLLNLSFASM